MAAEQGRWGHLAPCRCRSIGRTGSSGAAAATESREDGCHTWTPLGMGCFQALGSGVPLPSFLDTAAAPSRPEPQLPFPSRESHLHSKEENPGCLDLFIGH